MGDHMKCEYCGYEFYATQCPNCGALAPNYNNSSVTEINKQWTPPPIYNSKVKIRSVLACIILTFITCGLYILVWISYLNDESNYLSEETNPTSGTIAVLLIIFTCGLYSFYWAFKQGERIDRARMIRNITPKKLGVIYALLLLIPYAGVFISLGMMQNEINNLAV